MNLKRLLTTNIKNWFRPRQQEKPAAKPGTSKHGRAKTRPHGWHTKLRKERKRKKLARRAQRGKR